MDSLLKEIKTLRNLSTFSSITDFKNLTAATDFFNSSTSSPIAGFKSLAAATDFFNSSTSSPIAGFKSLVDATDFFNSSTSSPIAGFKSLAAATDFFNSSLLQLGIDDKSTDLPWSSKIQEMINDLNSSFPSKQNKRFKTFDPEKEALEEVVNILSDPLESNFEVRVDKFVLRNKYKIQILITVLTFLCWYFQEQVESLRVNSKKELISYVISKIQESNPELLTKTNSQTSETTSYQIDSSLEPQLKLNIFSEDQD